MSFLNEADTRAKLIDPALKRAGWGESQIEREHYFHKGRSITAGRIYLVGEQSRRREPRRVDYLFRAHNALSTAVVEAKDESHSVDAGLGKSKAHARLVSIPMKFSRTPAAVRTPNSITTRARSSPGWPGCRPRRWRGCVAGARSDSDGREGKRLGGLGSLAAIVLRGRAQPACTVAAVRARQLRAFGAAGQPPFRHGASARLACPTRAVSVTMMTAGREALHEKDD